MTETRKIAAILCSDVVGYSRLAGADEDRILARLRTLRSDLIDPTGIGERRLSPHRGHPATHTIANAKHPAGADAFADSIAPAIREAQAAGAKTLRQIAAALNGRGIGTARGGKCEATTVANVLRRMG
jgi:hypothetical protein